MNFKNDKSTIIPINVPGIQKYSLWHSSIQFILFSLFLWSPFPLQGAVGHPIPFHSVPWNQRCPDSSILSSDTLSLCPNPSLINLIWAPIIPFIGYPLNQASSKRYDPWLGVPFLLDSWRGNKLLLLPLRLPVELHGFVKISINSSSLLLVLSGLLESVLTCSSSILDR